MDLRQDDLSTQRRTFDRGSLVRERLREVPTSNARLLGEQCFSLPLNLLQAFLTIGPRSCRGGRPWRLGRWCRFPQKRELILQTDRRPQLETPLRYFWQDFTPKRSIFCGMVRGRYSDTR